MILVVGDVMDDVVVRPHGRVSPDSDTGADIEALAGGSGANVAAWIGHLGAPARFAGRVARADADRHAALLAAHGVEARLQADDEAPTGRVVTIAGRERRAMFTDRGANRRLTALPEALLEGVAIVHISGYVLFEAGARAAALALARAAAGRGIALSVDPNSASFLRAAGIEAFREWISGWALCFPNAAEARVLGGAEALARRCDLVVLKRGPGGAALYRRAAPPREVPGAAVPAVDPTGAGDAFAAAFLVARLRGEDDLAAARAAARAAGQVVTRPGGRPPAAC